MKPVVCFVGPSGVGKTSYTTRLVESFFFQVAAVATTRARRADDDSRYIYLTERDFLEHVRHRRFIEWDSYSNYYYGTIRESIKSIIDAPLAAGCILDLTPSGCRQVVAEIPDATIIALLPDEIGWLKRRLFERGTNTEAEIEGRIRLLEEFIVDVRSLDASFIYCSYSPESWKPTFDKITTVLNLG